MNAAKATTSHDPAKEEAILHAARLLFAEKGFGPCDVQDVADAAGVGKGTVYRYYESKETLFRAVADSGMRRLEEHINASMDPERAPDDLVRRLGFAYAEFFQSNPETVEILIQERAEFRGSIPDTHLFYRARNRGKFESILRRGIAEGVFRSVNVRMATTAFANVLYGTVVCGVMEGDTRRIGATAKHAVDIFLQGLIA